MHYRSFTLQVSLALVSVGGATASAQDHTAGIDKIFSWVAPDGPGCVVAVSQHGLNFVPGEEWSYSNSGYVLLPEIVARVSGQSFAEFARTRLFEPLGMKATTCVDDPQVVIRNRALAYEKQGGRWKMDMLLENDRGGAGAMFSTASDLLIWNGALTHARLGRFVSEKIQEPAILKNGRKLGYARGLNLDTNYAGSVIWHGGSAAAYKAVLSRYPESGFSIAILSNAGESADDRTRFAGRIFDLFVSPTGTRLIQPSAAPAGSAGVAGTDVSSRGGLFFNEHTGEPLRLVARNGRLIVAGGPPLVAVATDRFRNPRGILSFMSQDEFELQFLSDDRFELKSMEGATTWYRRAKPDAPTADDMKAFGGRYRSDELRAFLEMSPTKEGLMARLNDSPTKSLELRPVERDTFQQGMITVRFHRDEAGNVVALELSNPALRRIKFARANDAT